MSASVLRDTVARALQAKADEWTSALVSARDATLHDIGVKQGIIQGIEIASHELAEAYRELHQ